jgi:hypothetical protein
MPPPSASDKGIFPAARSRVVIRLAQGMKAKPNANTRTLRPDKCLVVSSFSPELRPASPRNTGENAVTTREGFAVLSDFRFSNSRGGGKVHS